MARLEIIALQRNEAVQGSDGGRVPTWVTFKTVAADVKPIRAGEQIKAQKERTHTAYRITVDRLSVCADAPPHALLVTGGERVVWITNNDLAMNVREIMDKGRRALDLEMVAEAGVPV